MNSLRTTPDCIHCRSNRAVRPYMQAYNRGVEKGIRRFFACRVCTLIFEDPAHFPDIEEWDFSVEPGELTPEVRAKFLDIFGEAIDISGEGGELYPRFGYEDSGAMVSSMFLSVQAALAELGLERPDARFSVLEVGCATGFLLREIKQHYPNAEVVGIEPSPVSCAKAGNVGTRVLCGTLDNLDLGADRFDLVLMFGNLQLHRDPFDSLRRAHRLLKSGGVIVFDYKNPRSFLRLACRYLQKVPGLRKAGPVRGLVARSYANMRFSFPRSSCSTFMQELGFRALDIRSKPPRALQSANADPHTHGVQGLIWRSANSVDRLRDEQAWIEVKCRKQA